MGNPFSQTNFFQNGAGQPQPTRQINGNSTFRKRPRQRRPAPVWLEHRTPSVKQITQQPDPWDVANQERIVAVEREMGHGDFQALYERLQAMRETERREIEKRGLVDAHDTQKSLSEAIAFVGTCQHKCPPFERIRRTYENNVKAMERDPVTNEVTPELAVKAFSRPAAGQLPPLPSDVRPPSVLRATLDYLIDTALPRLPESHSFLWDRTRSIRQDFTYQNFTGPEAIECNELIARIHLISLHVMAGADVEYSRQQELEQLGKTLQSLSEFYEDNRRRGLPSSKREPEMRAYQLLMHLHDPDLELLVQGLPREVFEHPMVQTALQLRAFMVSNMAQRQRGFSYTESAPGLFSWLFGQVRAGAGVTALMACIIETHFNGLRAAALRAMARSYHSRGKPYALSRLTGMLGFDDDAEAAAFCRHYNLPLVQDGGVECVQVTQWDDKADVMPLKQPCSRAVGAKLEAAGGGWPRLVRDDSDLFTGQTSTQVPVRAPVQAQAPFPVSRQTLQTQSNPFAQAAQPTQKSFSFGEPSQPVQKSFSFGEPAQPQPGPSKTTAPLFGQQPAQPAQTATQPTFALQKPEPQKQSQEQKPLFQFPAKPLPTINRTEATPSPTTIPGDQKPAQKPVPVPESALPVPAKPASPPPKPKPSEQDVREVLGVLLKEAVHAETLVVAERAWAKVKAERQQRRELLDTVANAFLAELVSGEVLTQTKYAVAQRIHERRIARNVIRRIKANAETSLARVHERRRRQHEYNAVVQQLGQPRRARVSSAQRRNVSLSEESYIETIRAARADAETLWAPYDLRTLLLEPIAAAFASTTDAPLLSFSHRLTVAFWSTDWSGTAGQWFRTKFGLQWDGAPGTTYENKIASPSTTVSLTALQQDPSTFASVGVVVVEIGVAVSPNFDEALLSEIAQRVTSHSRFRVSALLVNFGAPERVPDLSPYAGAFADIRVLTIPETGASDALTQSVKALLASFRVQLSPQGAREAEQRLADRAKAAADRAAAREAAEREQAAKDRLRKWNRLQAQTSLEYFRQLNNQQELLPRPSAKRKISDTPAPGPPQKSQRAVSDVVPKSVSQLRALVESVNRRNA